jgi:hypothetical protein
MLPALGIIGSIASVAGLIVSVIGNHQRDAGKVLGDSGYWSVPQQGQLLIEQQKQSASVGLLFCL